MAGQQDKAPWGDLLRVVSEGDSQHKTARGPEFAALGLTELEQLSLQLANLSSADEVVSQLLARLGIACDVSDTQLARIPDRGPLIVVCHQAIGTVEALVMHQVLKRRRPDVCLFGNLLLSGLPQLHSDLCFVDPGWRLASRVRNVLSLKAALRTLQQGGVMGVLPTADTAAFDHEAWQVVDPTWGQGVGDVIRASGANVLPVGFTGNVGALKSLFGMLAPAGTADSPRPRTIAVEIGAPVRAADIAKLDTGEHVTGYLRDRSAILATRARSERRQQLTKVQYRSDYAPIAAEGDAAEVEAEIAALPEHQKLLSNRGRLVAYARGAECPALLQEIGRLRQVAFRAVGEGTAEPRDLDRFDQWYDHLFVWNGQTRELIGAYRLGRLDALPAGEAPYTATLFKYDDALRARLAGAIELGRSFVRPEYQRSPAGLIMLWKGIAQYLIDNPRYRFLLGPVSMSADFSPTSQQLMVRYMETHAGAGPWQGLVEPRTPFDPEGARRRLWRRYGRWCADVAELSRWVGHIEPGGEALPVLIKSYLGLGGRMLAFNVDADFGDCVDALVLVDLTETPRATLDQFMGAEPAARFLAYHLPGTVATDGLAGAAE